MTVVCLVLYLAAALVAVMVMTMAASKGFHLVELMADLMVQQMAAAMAYL